MSRNHPFHPVPRGGIDPIRSADDALAVLALAAPFGHDTIAILLDADRCGTTLMIVSDTVDRDALFRVIDACVAAAQRTSIEALVVASSRPDGVMEAADAYRWLEASNQCRTGGVELVEWFVLGVSGPQRPRELLGEPERWER